MHSLFFRFRTLYFLLLLLGCLIGGWQQTIQAQEVKRDPAATRDYAVAVGFQNKQLHAQAIQRWQKFIQMYPTDPRLVRAVNHLGACQFQDKKYAEAATTFKDVLTKYPKFESLDATHFNLGLALYNIGLASKKEEDLATAAKAFGEVPGKSKHAPTALYYQGECLYNAGKLKEAIPVYRKVIATHPTSELLPEVYYALGTTQQEASDDKEAAATFQALLQKYLKDKLASEGRLRLGQSLFKQKLYGEAEKQFGQVAALSDFADADFAQVQQAQCLYQQKQIRPAATLYEALPKKFPKSKYVGYALLAAGKCWYQAEKFPQAQAALSGAFDAKLAEAPEAAYWLGLTLIKLKKPADAVAVLEKAITAHPQSGFLPQLTFTRINALAELPDRRKEAVALYVDFSKKHPDHELAPRGLYLAALASLKQEDFAAAQSHAEQFLADKKLAQHELVGEVLFIGGESFVQAANPDFTKAEGFYRRLVTEHPKHGHVSRAQLRIGLCQYLAKKYPESITFLTQALPGLKEPAQVAEAHFLIGRNHLDAGQLAYEQQKYADALGHYQQVVAQLPKNEMAAPALHGIGMTWFAKRDYKQAIEVFSKQISTYADSDLVPRTKYMRGLAYQRLKQFDEALKDLEAFVAAKPPEKECLDARYALALCQSGLKKYEQAAATLGALLKDKPDYAQADQLYYEMGFALLQAKKEKEAVEAFRQLASKLPDSPLVAESWFRVGEFHEGAKQPEEAAKAYAAGLAKVTNPQLKEKLQYKLGWIQYKMEKFAAAAAVLQTQVKEHPKGKLLMDATYLAGECLFRQDKNQEALPIFEQVIQAKDNKYHARALYRAGACQANLKQWAASQKQYAALIEQFPKFDLLNEARYGVGWALQNQQKLDAAKAAYLEVTKATTTETAAKSRFMIGECAFGQKKYQEAVEHLLEAALGYPYEEWQAQSYFEAGRCYIELKDKPKAVDALETVVKKYPKHALANDAATLIADLKK